jgi:hypothetical protein
MISAENARSLAKEGAALLAKGRDAHRAPCLRDDAYQRAIFSYNQAMRALPAADQAVIQKNLSKAYAESAALEAAQRGWDADKIYAHWIPAFYSAACEAVRGLPAEKAEAVKGDVSLFLESWLASLDVAGAACEARCRRMAALPPPLLGADVEVAWGAIQLRYAQAIFNQVQGVIDHNTLHQCIKGSREDIDPWVKALQIVQRTRIPLGRVKALKVTPKMLEELGELSNQVVFLQSRAQNVVNTWQAVQKQSGSLLESDEFDMDGILDTLDDFRHVLMMAQGAPAEGDDDSTRTQMDTECCCIALHHIAKLHETVFQVEEKAYKLHLETVRLGLSLTTEAIDESAVPVGALASKGWYMASLKFVQKVRRQREAKEAQRRSEELKTIQPELDAVTAANSGMLPLIRWLYQHQPPHNGNPCKLPDDVTTDEHVTKKYLLIVIRDYSPNPFTGDASMRKVELLYTEIQKMLNHYYECNFKGSPPPDSSTDGSSTDGNSTDGSSTAS